MAAVVVAVGAIIGVALLLIWFTYSEGSTLSTGARPVLPPRERARLAEAVAAARWAPAHDEVDGRTRVLLRRAITGPDGLPVVLDERVFATFPADDPAWEGRFTEAMAGARYRCAYLNAEEDGA